MQTITDDLAARLKSKFQAAADGFRARLEVETDVVAACSVDSMEFIADDITNEFTYDWDLSNPAAGGFSPKTAAISAPVENPSLLLAILNIENTSDYLGGDLTVASPWTMLDGDLHTGDWTYNRTLSGIAYLPYTGAAIPDVQFSWDGAYVRAGASIVTSVAIHTSATSDVQHVGNARSTSAPALHLPSAPTEGNLLLMVSLGGTPAPPPGDWVTVHEIDPARDWHQFGTIGVYMRCVGAGESQDVATTQRAGQVKWDYVSEWAVEATTVGFAPHVVTRVSIDKSLQTDADAFEVELDNSDGSKSLYPAGAVYLPTKRIRIFQWYGDSPNVVQVFDGFIDKVQEHRNPMTLTLTGRCWMKRLLVQDILVTAPQGAAEDGAVRDPTNYVYLNMEVSDIVDDLLDKANYPTGAARSVQQTSFQVAEFLGSDGNAFTDALVELADLVGYNSYADEHGVYHFEANARAQSTDTDTPDAPVWTFRASEDIVVIDPEQDDLDEKTRIRVTGPMSTTVLNDAFTELWHSAAVKKPTGVWFDATDAGNVRVADGATRKLYKVSQTTRAIVNSTAALCSHFLGDVTGDPSDASKYWILELPWKNGLPGTASTVYQLAKSDNSVLASFALPSGRWTGMDVDASNVWLANWDTNQIHKYTRAGASVASYTLSDGGVAQVDPTGVIVDGTTLYVFFYNTNRILVSTTSAPATITKTISTAGTQMLGGEVDSVTHTEFWACSDSLGLVWKYTLAEPVTTDRTVYVEVTNDAVGVNSSPGLSAFETALGEVRRSVIRMDAITSLAQATETAQRWLGQLDHTRQQLDVGIIGNPAIQKGDMVRIEDPVSGIASDWGVDTYRSEMSGEAGTYLGTLSLLPWDPRY